MKAIQAVVIRLRWRDLPLLIPLAFCAVLLIPPALFLVCLFEKLGWLEFVDVWDERW